MTTTWRYILSKLNGDGTETIIDYNLPLSGVEIQTTLNGHGGIKGTLTPEHPHVKKYEIDTWRNAIYAEADGHIRGGGIVETITADGPNLTIDCIGHTGYLTDTRYTGITSIERGDPLKTAWHLWQHTQKRPGYNLGITQTGDTKSRQMFLADDTIEPGTNPQKIDPYTLTWWSTHDLAKEFDALAELAPFEWTCTHAWNGEHIKHELNFGYPRLGRRNNDALLIEGVNVTQRPQFESRPDDYATQIFVIGAGEGSAMMHHTATTATQKHLARDAVIIDKSITTPTAARKRADAELRSRVGSPNLDQLTVIDHPTAPVGALTVGDDVRLQTADGWADPQNIWVKLLAITTHPEKQTLDVTVKRAEKVTHG